MWFWIVTIVCNKFFKLAKRSSDCKGLWYQNKMIASKISENVFQQRFFLLRGLLFGEKNFIIDVWRLRNYLFRYERTAKTALFWRCFPRLFFVGYIDSLSCCLFINCNIFTCNTQAFLMIFVTKKSQNPLTELLNTQF